MNTHWSPTTKYMAAVGLLIAGIVVIYLSQAFLGVILMAGILAFLTLPIVRFLNSRLRFPRGLAAATTYILLILLIVLVPVILTPIAIDAVRAINVDAFVSWLQDQADAAEEWLTSIRTLHIFYFEISLASVVDPVLEVLAGTTPSELTSLERLLDLAPSAVGSVTNVATYLLQTFSSVAFYAFLTLIVSIYLSIDATRFYRGMIQALPEAYQDEFRTLIGKIVFVWTAYFRGQITVSVILSLLTWLGTAAVGLPGAFILGLVAGLLALIPSLGPILSFIPAGIVALVQGSSYLAVSNLTFLFIVGGVYLIIQQLEGNFITPRIVGSAIHLPPVVILLGVLIGTSTFGLLGAVLASPTIATFKVLATYVWNKIFDRDPFYQLETSPPRMVPRKPIAQTVRTTYESLQEQYQQLASVARKWPPADDEEE